MSLKDKLEIGLKPDAPYRPDNLPDFQRDDSACEGAATPGDSAPVRQAREACTTPVAPKTSRSRGKRKSSRARTSG